MKITKHCQSRMSQRGIPKEFIELALEHGTPAGDGKVVLDRRTLNAIISNLSQFARRLHEALERGGLVVVSENDTLLTTYRLENFSRRKTKRPKVKS